MNNCNPQSDAETGRDQRDWRSDNDKLGQDRRTFLKTAGTALGFGLLASDDANAGEASAPVKGLIDVNVNLSRWPMRRLAGDDPRELAAKLRRAGVAQAWAGSFDGVFHKDIAAANTRLVEECRQHGGGRLLPFGSVNPMLPDWEEELRRCAEVHGMRGIRLHPNYHGYKLDDPVFARLLKLAADRRLIVQIALLMEGERMMHPVLRVAPVSTAPLAALVRQTPSLRLVLLNALGGLRGRPLTDLLAAGDVSVEISMLEGVGGLGKLLEQAPPTRVLFGSHAPLFYFESALLKLKESALNSDPLHALCRGNAQRLLTGARAG